MPRPNPKQQGSAKEGGAPPLDDGLCNICLLEVDRSEEFIRGVAAPRPLAPWTRPALRLASPNLAFGCAGTCTKCGERTYHRCVPPNSCTSFVHTRLHAPAGLGPHARPTSPHSTTH